MQVIHKKSKITLVKSETKESLTERVSVRHYQDPEDLCGAFYAWLDNAIPGEKFCYYRGKYVSGKKVGGAVRRAYENGLIAMYQSKISADIFCYWAEKRGR
jgi:hypothetical protein